MISDIWDLNFGNQIGHTSLHKIKSLPLNLGKYLMFKVKDQRNRHEKWKTIRNDHIRPLRLDQDLTPETIF